MLLNRKEQKKNYMDSNNRNTVAGLSQIIVHNCKVKFKKYNKTKVMVITVSVYDLSRSKCIR